MRIGMKTFGNRPYMVAVVIWAVVLFILIGEGDESSENSVLLYKIFVAAVGVSAALMMLIPKKRMGIAVSAFSMMLGAVSAYTSFVQLGTSTGIYAMCAFIKCMVSVGMIAVGLLIYSGMRVNIQRMIMLSIAYCLVDVLPFLFDCAIRNMSLLTLIEFHKLELISLGAPLLLLIMLFDPEVRFTSNKRSFKIAVKRIHETRPHVNRVFVEGEDISIMSGEGSWTEISGGPIVAEKKIKIHMDAAAYDFILSKWSDGKVTGDITLNDDRTHVQSTRFIFREIVIDEAAGKAYVFGEDGFYFTLEIVNRRARERSYTKMQRFLNGLLKLES